MFRKAGIVCAIVRQFHQDVAVLGVPFDKGQRRAGVAKGPAAIRKAGLVQELKDIHDDINVEDFGDISYQVDDSIEEVPNMSKYAEVACCNHSISKSVERIIASGKLCITLGGDHSIGIGSVDGHLKAKDSNICLIWVDAHADLNTNKTSDSGNVHGMPLALLIKELSDYWPYLPGMDWQQPIMSIRNVAYIGLRSVDNYERLLIEKLGITVFGMEDVEDLGISVVAKMALEKIDPEMSKSIHVSFDIDSLDSLEAPSTGTAVRGGLTLREGVYLMELIQRSGRLGAMDLVEVNPEIGNESDVKKTVEAAIHLIKAACGHQRRGLRPNNTDTIPLLQTLPPTQNPI